MLGKFLGASSQTHFGSELEAQHVPQKFKPQTLEVVECKSIVVKVLVFSQKVGRLNEKGAPSNCQVVEADVPKQANSQMLRTRNVTITGFAVLVLSFRIWSSYRPFLGWAVAQHSIAWSGNWTGAHKHRPKCQHSCH